MVAAYAERLLQEAAQSDLERCIPFVDQSRVGSDLRTILETGAHGIRACDRAMLELGFWSRSYVGELGPVKLTEIVLSEMVNLYLDQGKSESEFVAAMQRGFASVKAAREAIETPDDDRSEE
jgi:hypothetical protein